MTRYLSRHAYPNSDKSCFTDDGNFGNENNDGIFNNENNDGKNRRHSSSLPHFAWQGEREVVLPIMIVMKFTVTNMMNELSGSEGWRMLPVCDGLGIL